MRAEGHGSSAEASPSRKGSRKLMFSESLALNMQVEPAMYVYVSSQPFNHNLEALNEATKLKCFQEHVFLGLGTILASNPRSISGHTTFAEAPRKLRGSPKVNTGSIPMPLLPKSVLLSYGKPQ